MKQIPNIARDVIISTIIIETGIFYVALIVAKL